MERVGTLLNKLQRQVEQKASLDEMLITVQMLQSELIHLKSESPVASGSSVAIDMPTIFTMPLQENVAGEIPEKIVEVLQVDEAEMEAELEEIKRNADSRNQMSAQNKPQMLFDPIEDTPTLIHQRPTEEPKKVERKAEVNETLPFYNTNSLNDRLKEAKTELSEVLQEGSIKDLRKAIGVNDRFLYINELFRGDEVMYERSIKTINGFTIFPEAEYWIKRELKLKLGWNDSNPFVKQFDHLVRRRFSAT